MKHDELQNDLAAHLLTNSERLVWTNVQMGPSGSPRPDVFTVAKSYARFAADAYECKVSVSDLRSDVTSGKWQSYRPFAHRVWFAFPRGMASLDLVPKECGVILRSDTGWRAARKPVAQVLDSLPRDAWLKLLLTESQVQAKAHRDTPRRADWWRAEKLVRERMGDELAWLFADVASAESLLRIKRENLGSELAAIDARIADRRKYAETEAAAQRAALDSEIAELGRLVGADDPHGAASVTRALRAFIWRIDRSGPQISELIKSLSELQGLVSLTGPEVVDDV